MKNIFPIASIILLSLELFPVRSLAINSLSHKYHQATNQNYIVQFKNSAQYYFEQGNIKVGLDNKQGAIADYDRAIADYDRAIAINPKFAEAYHNRGNAKSALGNKQSAMIDYDRAIAINPKFVKAYNSRGNAKWDLGNQQAAMIDYDRAIAINPKFAEAYYNRGNAKSALGNKQGAVVDLNTAAEIFRQEGRMNLYQQAMGLLKKLQGN